MLASEEQGGSVVADFVPVLDLSDLPEGGLRSVVVAGQRVLLANDGGTVRAIGGVCTHEQEDLANGDLEGGSVVCAMHFARFSLTTGAVLAGPTELPEPVYAVRVEDGRIFVSTAPRERG